MFKKEEKKIGVLGTILIIVGSVVFLMSVMVVIYKVFKKYFRVTLECGDCGICDEDCFCEEDDFEPECCIYDGVPCGGLADDIGDALAEDLDNAE